MDERIDRGLELLVVWALLASALGLVSALAGHFLAPQVWLSSFLLTALYAWRVRKTHVSLGVSPDWRHLAVLLLVGLFFRLPAYHYVLGGQDEGLYVNIAHYIERTGGVDVEDTVLAKLQGSPFVDTYLAENRVANTAYLPGIYSPDFRGVGLEFQFYHLFPIWMALFEGVFGASFGVYALSFFSCLSIVFFYRLALVISGSRRTALVAGLLLALNPLHVFFSKFPVTEVPALAFSLIGFTYLAAFWNRRGPQDNNCWLWVSAACFGALFVTRISGFMYMPFFIVMGIASALADPDYLRRRAIIGWALGTVALYALSIWYGLHWSSQYARDIYKLSFGQIFHNKWRADIVAVISFGLGSWLALTFLARFDHARECMRRYLLEPARKAVGVIVVFGLVAGAFRIYQLGWTDHFIRDAWLGGFWNLSHSGTMAIKASSLFATVVYLGPLLPACFLVWVVRRQSDPRIEFLRLFVAGFLVYAALLQWTVAYGPYYARYLLSELVPYLILFVVLVWSGMYSSPWKKVIKGALAMSLVYMALASAAQLGKSENDGLYDALSQLLVPVDAGDLVLIDSLSTGFPTASEIKTPVLYTFGLNSVSVSDESLKNHGYLVALNARYDDVFLVSDNAVTPRGFEPIGSTRVKDWAFVPSHSFPHRLRLRGDKRLYLSLLARPVIPLASKQPFDLAASWASWLVSGWSTPETWGTWSVGKSAVLAIDPRQLPLAEHGLRLHFDVSAYLTPRHTRQRIGVSLNGVYVGHYELVYPNLQAGIDVDLPPPLLASAQKIRLEFSLPDATSPNAGGASTDDRALGLGLKAVTVTRLPPGPTAVPEKLPDTIDKKQP